MTKTEEVLKLSGEGLEQRTLASHLKVEFMKNLASNRRIASTRSLVELARGEFLSGDRQRGDSLYLHGQIEITAIGSEGAIGIVEGSSVPFYVVGIDVNDTTDRLLGVSCECPRFLDTCACKHVWAFLQACDKAGLPCFSDKPLQLFEADASELEIGEPLSQRQPYRSKSASKHRGRPHKPVKWKQQLQTVSAGMLFQNKAFPTFHQDVATETQNYFVIQLSDFASLNPLTIHLYQSTRKKDRGWSKPKSATMRPESVFQIRDCNERSVLSMMMPAQELGYRGYHDQGVGSFHVQAALLSETLAKLAGTQRLLWTMDGGTYIDLDDARVLRNIDAPPWRLQVQVKAVTDEKGSNRVQLQPRLIRTVEHDRCDVLAVADVVGVTLEGTLLQPDSIERVDDTQVAMLHGFQQTGVIDVPARSLNSVLETVCEWQNVDVLIDDDLPIEIRREAPHPKLLLSSPESGQSQLCGDISMVYGEDEIDVLSGQTRHWNHKAKQILCRDLQAEQAWLETLDTSWFRCDGDPSELRLPRKSLPDVVKNLTAAGWEVIADGSAIRKAGSFDIRVESGQDWFDVHASADFGGQSVSLPELLNVMKLGHQYIVLDDGSHGMLPEEWLQKFGGLTDAGETDDDTIRFTKTQALLLDAMLADQENVSLDRAFKAWCEKLNSFEGIAPSDAPEFFQGELREYQQLGLGWLNFLNEFRLGGCLADDMGLGKTIQVLSMLEQRRTRKLGKKEIRLPSLVVVPKSLIFNWIEEAAKFTPNLKMLDYTGTDRKHHRESLADHDVIITTYGTMRIDAAILREQAFDYVILDEAQAIKNPSSQAAKASRLMTAEHRLAMTGTPVENHLGDLWSLFDFLNPGMLGHTLGSANLGATAENEERLGHVAKALRPFILRRTKQEVLTELPDKTEQTLHCDMEPKQKKLYVELRDHYRKLITGKVQEVGLAKSKMHVLEALLRLRQAACDPRLVRPDCGVKGSKIISTMHQLEELIGDGHKALVFSQFTSLLALLRQEMDAKGWDYEYLDGKTSQKNRQANVERFQNDESCKLFLISLKAGGHGLNLTAADYVFILDPWWNPAVEAQAIDRAHRMGQQNPVNAYRMIARDTVEEKIVDLQSSKRKLADAIISQQKSLISDLTSDDLRMLFE